MKRVLYVLFLLPPMPALAQTAWTPPALDTVIVEFRDAPVALAKTSIDYRATLMRFRADLTSLSRSAEVRREYFRVLNGAAVGAPRGDVAAIARLPYVRSIHTDHEMHAMAGPATSQINAMGTSVLADLTPNIAAAIGVGLLIFAALFAASLVWPAIRQAKKGKSGG